MKYLLALLFAPSLAYSQVAVQDVHEVAKSSNTLTQTIQLPCTATNVANATSSGTVKAAFAIEVYNVAAASKTAICGFDQNLSTSPYGAWYGREVPAGIGVYYATSPNRPLFCASQINCPGTVPMTVTQFK